MTFFNNLCLCCGDHDGFFEAHIEFMHMSNVPPSWKRAYMHTFHIP